MQIPLRNPFGNPCKLLFHLVIFGTLSQCFASDFWQEKAFGLEPDAILEHVETIKSAEAVDVQVFLIEQKYVVDLQGKCHFSQRLIYRPLNIHGVEEWSSVEINWEPWRQERPSARVRVISPTGQVHWLDPKTLDDAPAKDSSHNIHVDDRVVRAPIPAVTVGAVVEEEQSVREKIAAFPMGNVKRIYFGLSVPVERHRLIVEVPEGTPFRHVVHLLPGLNPQKKVSRGIERWVFEAGPLPAWEDPEPGLPYDMPRYPHVAFSTAESWGKVAGAYAELIDNQLKLADVGAIVKRVVPANTSREETIKLLTAFLHREVRYTGLEFGRQAIVPEKPETILGRKYGDCKDKSALLVALLARAGIPAELALLSSGYGEDVEAELPGLGLFDHAIVYIPGDYPMWIDATDEFSLPGNLTSSCQGRRALIADSRTTNLTVIPESSSRDNRHFEKREFTLSEMGPARVIETTTLKGEEDQNYRSSYASSEEKEEREQLEQYITRAYAADKLESHEVTDPFDLSKPFTLKIVAAEASRGTTAENDAAVGVPIGWITERLPDRIKAEEEEDKTKASGKKEKPERKADYLLSEAFVTEWLYEIRYPEGFRPAELPQNRSESWAGATLTCEYADAGPGLVTARFVFDTHKRRFTAAELKELTAGVRKLRNEPIAIINFQQIGQSCLAAGQIREAIVEFKRLTDMHPKEALHRIQIANALLSAGLGEAARGQAKMGTVLEPESSAAWKTLAHVLEHDSVGRRFKKGCDIEGAEAAYRKAMAIDGEDYEAKASLAILLEHEETGRRYMNSSRLTQAIEIYKAMADHLADVGVSNNYPVALLHAGRYKEVRDLAKADKDKVNSTHELVAIAAEEGAQAAIQKASTMVGGAEARNQLLRTAASVAMQLRLYPQASQLMSAGAPGTPNSSQLLSVSSMLSKARRFEEVFADEDNPENLARKVSLWLSLSDPPPGLAERVFSVKSLARAGSSHELAKARRAIRKILNQSGNPEMSTELAGEIGISAMEVRKDGDDSLGYRLAVRFPSVPGFGEKYMYVVKEPAGYRVLLAVTDMGLEILTRLERDDAASARRWLDWVMADEDALGGDEETGPSQAFRFWNDKRKPKDENIRYAAACLLMSRDEAVRIAEPILIKGRSRAKKDERADFDYALLSMALLGKDYAKAVEHCKALLKETPEGEGPVFTLVRAYSNLKQWEEVERLIDKLRKQKPEDLSVLRELSMMHLRRGSYEQAREVCQKVVDLGKAEALDLNNLAWSCLMVGQVGQTEVDLAQKGALMTQNKQSYILHTVAALYAEVGKIAEARDLIWQTVLVMGLEEPDDNAWYVFGRISEQLGMNEAAISSYQRAIGMNDPGEPGSVPELAARGLKRLGQPASSRLN